MINSEYQKKMLIGLGISIFLNILYITDIFGFIKMEKTIQSQWIGEFQFWLLLGLIFLITFFVEKKKFLLWKETKQIWYFYPLSVFGIFLGAVIVGITIPLVFKMLELPLQQEKLSSLVNFYCEDKMLLVFSSLTAGVVEELLFRGYLMPRIEIFLKKGWLVIFISTLLFGLGHTTGFSLIGLVTPLLIGFIFSYHYYRFKNIRVLIFSHFLIDFASFITSCQ
jgi:membrane protease YdiL (CAAX protease family)